MNREEVDLKNTWIKPQISNICVAEDPEEERKDRRAEKYLKKQQLNFPNLKKDINPQIQDKWMQTR